jgi:hypothetical protein
MKEKDSDGAMHVRLDNPLSFRKTVLTGAIDSVKLLKVLDSGEVIRSRKEGLKRELDENLVELKKLVKELKEKLPHIKVEKKTVEKPKVVKLPVKPKSTKVIKKEKVAVKMPPKSRLDREIEEIEEKLRHLEI